MKFDELDHIAGFEKPTIAGDNIVLQLRRKHALPEQASMAEIEPVAQALLENLLTAHDAAELVLNRRVDGKETLIGQLIYTPGFTPKERFALLLMEAVTEKNMKAAGKIDLETT